MLIQFSPIVAFAGTNGGPSVDVLGKAVTPEVDADDAVVDGTADETGRGHVDLDDSIGMHRDDLEGFLEAVGAAEAEAAPNEAFTPNSREVISDDGVHTTEIFQDPTFKRNDDGEWIPLDGTVVQSSSGRPVAQDTLVPITFGDHESSLIEFDTGSESVTVVATGLDIGKPTINGSTVRYEGVAPGADIEYVVGPTQVKENIILQTPDAPRGYTFFLSDPSGALGQPTPDGAGGWVFIDEDAAPDALQLRIPPGIAYEADAPIDSGVLALSPDHGKSATIAVESVDGGFNVTVALDEKWAAEHEFPIVLDPSWAWGHPGSGTTGQGPQSGNWSAGGTLDPTHAGLAGWSYRNPACTTPSPTTCVPFTTTQYLYSGSIPAYNVQNIRSYVRFPYSMSAATMRENFAGTILNLPLRADVQYGGLWVRFQGCMQTAPVPAVGQNCPGANPRGIDVHNMTGPWTASSTWQDLANATAAAPENQDPALVPVGGGSLVPNSPNNWKSVNEPVGLKSALSYSPPDPVNWFPNNGPLGYDRHAWQLLSASDIVQDWVNDPATAYGLAIRARNETPQAGTTATGSYWYSPQRDPQIPNPDQMLPLLQVVWQWKRPGKPSAALGEANGSKITASVEQSTTGTYAWQYDGWLFDAATDRVVARCRNFLPGSAQPIAPTGRVGCTFDENVPAGSFYVAMAAYNDAGYSDVAQSPVFSVGKVSGLGYEPWWTFEERSVGLDAKAAVNVGNGNLVVQNTDGTTVQGHGQLGYVLRRTYNSQADTTLGLPGDGLGQGWTFNVATSGEVGAPLAAGLNITDPISHFDPGNVTLVDRDGTEHTFTYDNTSIAVKTGAGPGFALPLDLQHLLGLLNTTDPAGVLADLLDVAGTLLTDAPIDPTKIAICIDTTYKAPAGVQMSLWRYVAIDPNKSCDSNLTTGEGPLGLDPFVIGYSTMTTDRVRQDFAVTGQLVSQVDSRGNELRYVYDVEVPVVGARLGHLRFIYEPRSCPSGPQNPIVLPGTGFNSLAYFPAGSTCRRMTFNYGVEGVNATTTVTDPAGRNTKYIVDGLGLGNLLSATTTAQNGDVVEAWKYTYCGTPMKLCTIVDPRGIATPADAAKHTTTVTYANGKVQTLRQRHGVEPTSGPSAGEVTTTFTYDNATPVSGAVATIATQNGRAHRFSYKMNDAARRVVQLAAGTPSAVAANDLVTKTTYEWDTPGCVPGDLPGLFNGNNLCRVTNHAGTVTTGGIDPVPAAWINPTDDDLITEYKYNPEGRVLTVRTGDGTTWLTTKNSYRTAYWTSGAGAAPIVVEDDDGVIGNRSALYVQPSTGLEFWSHKPVLYAVSDLVRTKSPQGRTIEISVDNSVAVKPGTMGLTCGAGNTGLTCSETARQPNEPQGDLVTSYTYDSFGQRRTTVDPDGVVTRFVYYGDDEADLSGNVSAGGWLKAVVDAGPAAVAGAPDPVKQNAVVFAYDRAGNPARIWGRNATGRLREANPAMTVDQIIGAFPGSVGTPPAVSGNPLPYTESLFAAGSSATAVGNPSRYLRSSTDPVGGKTTIETIDANGNALRTRTPRGNAAGNNSFDVVREFNSRDQLVTESVPANAGALIRYTYDEAGRMTTATDPNGVVSQSVYDAAGRQIERRIARGSWDGDRDDENCVEGSGSPYSSGTKVCITRTYLDGTGRPYLSVSPSMGLTFTSMDFAGRPTDQFVLRTADSDDNASNGRSPVWLRSSKRFDGDDHVLRVCSPEQFVHTPNADCEGAEDTAYRYSKSFKYTDAGRLEETISYREQVVSDPTIDNPFQAGGWDTLSEKYEYDKSGNLTKTTRPDGLAVQVTYDDLNRPISTQNARTASTSSIATFDYDRSGNLVKEVLTATGDQGSTTTLYTYDDANRLIDTIEAASGADPTTLIATAPTDLVVQNVRTRNVYDPDGNLVGQFEPRAFTTSVSSPDTRFLTRVDFDASGRPVALWKPFYDTTVGSGYETVAGGIELTECPTPRTNHAPAVVAVPAGQPAVPGYTSNTGVCVKRRTYDAAGNMTSDRNEISSTLSATNPSQFINDTSYVAFAYTQDNLLSEVTAPNPSTTPDPSHPAESGLTNRVRLANFTYDASGRLTVIDNRGADPTGTRSWLTETRYFLDGLVQREGKRASDAPADTFDAEGRYTYDANGARIQVAQLERSVERTWRYDQVVYFADGTIAEQTKGAIGPGGAEPNQVPSTTRYARDLNGFEKTVWSPSAVADDATNDQYNLPTRAIFSSDGLLLETTEPVEEDGSVRRQTTYAYNRLGLKTSQKAKKIAPDGTEIPNTMLNALEFSYNDNGWLRSETGRNGETIEHRYWANGLAFETKDSSSGSVTTDRPYLNGLTRTTSQTATGLAPTYMAFRYYADGRPYAQGSYTNAAMTAYETLTSYTYNAARLITAVGAAGSGAFSGGSGTWAYTYDRAGRISRITDAAARQTINTWNVDGTLTNRDVYTVPQPTTGSPIQAQRIQRWAYDYDGLDRLTAQRTYDSSSTPFSDFQFSYDPNGRVDKFTTPSSSDAVEYDANGNRTGYRGQSASYRPDNSTVSVDYDSAGRRTQAGSTKFAYDGFDRVRCASASGSCSSTAGDTAFTYDGLGRQTSSVSGVGGSTETRAQRYIGSTSMLLSEIHSTKPAETARYFSSPTVPLATVSGAAGSAVEYLNTDGAGNIALTTRHTGSTPSSASGCRVRFDPWGAPVADDGQALQVPDPTQPGQVMEPADPCSNSATSNNSLWFRTALRDGDTGAYKMGARNYEPSTGTWLTADTFGAGSSAPMRSVSADPLLMNRYSYLNGDPINLRDPSGHGPWSEVDEVAPGCWDCPPPTYDESKPGIVILPSALPPPTAPVDEWTDAELNELEIVFERCIDNYVTTCYSGGDENDEKGSLGWNSWFVRTYIDNLIAQGVVRRGGMSGNQIVPAGELAEISTNVTVDVHPVSPTEFGVLFRSYHQGFRETLAAPIELTGTVADWVSVIGAGTCLVTGGLGCGVAVTAGTVGKWADIAGAALTCGDDGFSEPSCHLALTQVAVDQLFDRHFKFPTDLPNGADLNLISNMASGTLGLGLNALGTFLQDDRFEALGPQSGAAGMFPTGDGDEQGLVIWTTHSFTEAR